MKRITSAGITRKKITRKNINFSKSSGQRYFETQIDNGSTAKEVEVTQKVRVSAWAAPSRKTTSRKRSLQAMGCQVEL